MFEELDPATFPDIDAKLTQRTWKPLYHAINKLLIHVGAYGDCDSRSKEVQEVMIAMYAIDDGVYVDLF